MSIISIEIIHSHDPHEFKKKVNAFLDKNEEMVFHDKTVYGITHVLNATQYSAIFQLEGMVKPYAIT